MDPAANASMSPASPFLDPPGAEILLTGISGSFPDSESVKELGENLFNKVDLLSDDERRWKPNNPEMWYLRTGKLKQIDKFDASFFDIDYKIAHAMDPGCRILLEKTYECIIDAGLNPDELRNTNTGVFIGSCYSESEKKWFYDKMQVNNYAITGCARSMLAHRISAWLGLKGPSYVTDTACSSSLYALEHAVKAIREGICDAAIVGGAHLILHPIVSLKFSRLGVLSPDGRCKSFDNSANGYARSEAVVACLLQKAKDSRRVYAQLVHAKTNCDGYKAQSITYPAGNIQKLLLQEFYEECGIPPSSLEFLEAHGTGTVAGDPEELGAIDEVFCTGRSDPLLIGSVKSNLGHTEPSSGLCSVAKLCIAYSTGHIPPNINFSTPREGVTGFTEGHFQVVTEKLPWNRGMAGVSSFGFGGANAHILMKNFARNKVNNGLPSDSLPRLVCVSGRTEAAVATILNELQSKPVDVEEVRLWHAIHNQNVCGHAYRGYTLLGTTPIKSVSLARSIQHISEVHRPLWFMYSGIESQYKTVASQLIRMPVFAAAIQKCNIALGTKGFNLNNLITDSNRHFHDGILNSLVGITAVHIGLTDVLKSVGIEPDHIIGHGVGELGCAYANHCLTVEQTILAAHSIGVALEKNCKGLMVTVRLGYNKIKGMCPPEVEVVRHSDAACSTVSGPTDAVKRFVMELKAQGVAVDPVSDIAFHSRYISQHASEILKSLREVIPSSTRCSECWVSPSIAQAQWKESNAELCSAEYLTNNLLSPVLFDEVSRLVQPHAVVVQLGPHGALQTAPAHSLHEDVVNIALADKHRDNVLVLLTALGRLYETGLNPQIDHLYPHVPLPVSQGTPMLSHLVKWQHSENWYVPLFIESDNIKCAERTVYVSLQYDGCEYLAGHAIDGRIIYPATGYLVLVWETLAMLMGRSYTEVSVVFEEVNFHRATNMPAAATVEFIVSIQDKSGNFEISENGTSVVTGRVYAKDKVGKDFRVIPAAPNDTVTNPHDKYLITKDFYKELHLRGYQYSGQFRKVLGCTAAGTRGCLLWEQNWTTFLDTMLQMKIVSCDTRSLYVPTRVEKISIDVDMHRDLVLDKDFCTRNSLECRIYPDIDVIRCSGVEVRGIHVTAISKKLSSGIPVYEKNIFISNDNTSSLLLEDILRIDLQIIVENIQTYKFKSIELVDEVYKNNQFEPVTEKVANVLADMPLMQAELLVLSQAPLTMPVTITVANKKLSEETNATIFIGANLLDRPQVLKEGVATLKDNCFVLSREPIQPVPHKYSHTYDIVTMHNTESEHLVLLRQKVKSLTTKFVKIITADQTFAWIDEVKEEIKEGQKIVLYSQDENINGLLGFVNCLRKEPGGEMIHGLLIADPTAPPFNPELEFYKEQLNKGLALNVYKDGEWGTYRHILLKNLDTVHVPQAYVNTTTIGDISSLTWLEGSYKPNQELKTGKKVVHVYCSALNFRDVMTAMGRVTLDAVARGRLAQDCVQGIEVSGRTSNGSRVMGVCSKGISNLVEADADLLWSIPDEWTFVEAATIPVAYSTVYLALVLVGKIRRGESILIHAGSGGVGQAAISVALHYGLEVFTTVGTATKRAFVKRLFPQLKDSHIGNSRNTSFEDMIRRETDGKGVDLVLNSLADEKLQVSARLLKRRGRFLEIGKYDITNNTQLQMSSFKKEISFHGIMLDYIFDHKSARIKKSLQKLLVSGIDSGAVRPLTYCTFEKHEIEPAYRYMAAGKHIGKVVIKIRDEECGQSLVKPTVTFINAVPRYTCHEKHVYVLVGGLSGFGLELADWLVLRGARKLMITSRRGVSNGYQALRIKIWASYGTNVQISTHDITTESGCEEMLKLAASMGPVAAIFNLAVILRDAVFQNQTPETFLTSFGPKALATLNLDKVSRKVCPELKDFVVFSSVSCGRGNAGQTNYGLSNSVMERICEERKRVGLPALAIQWGAIGDVGLVADMQEENIQLEIGGTLQQRISSCLQALDKFLKQDECIVSSMVVAEKKTRGSGDGSMVDAITQIMGITDLRTVSQQVALAELGMDSIMAVEIKQMLERDFEMFLTAKEIRTLTFAKLAELTARREADTATSTTASAAANDSIGLGILIRNFGDEKLASKPYIYMPTLVSDGTENEETNVIAEDPIFMLPGLEGCAATLASLCSKLQARACVLQLGLENITENFDEMVQRIYKTVKARLAPGAPFYLLGYSFGSLPVLHLAALLESEGHKGIVFCLDGSPDFVFSFVNSVTMTDTDVLLQNSIIIHTLKLLLQEKTFADDLISKLNIIDSYEDKLNYAAHYYSTVRHGDEKFTKNFIKSMALAVYNRIKIILNFNERKINKFSSPIILMRPKRNPPIIVCEQNYGLDKFTDSTVTVYCWEADHVSIVEDNEAANIINKVLAEAHSNNKKITLENEANLIKKPRQIGV